MNAELITQDKEISPSELIKQAILSNANLEQLEKLLALRERFEANEAKKAYHIAMTAFKANPPKIDKDKTVSYSTGAGKTTYNHATLANVTEKINNELSKHGLSASWSTKQNGTINVTCRITHVKGHSEETTLSAEADLSGSKNKIQAIGSTITYLERYTLLALTGLATYEQDDDAEGVEDDRLDEKQLVQVRNKLAEVKKIKPNLDEVKFLDFLQVDSLERIRKVDFSKAMNSLESAKKAQK